VATSTASASPGISAAARESTTDDPSGDQVGSGSAKSPIEPSAGSGISRSRAPAAPCTASRDPPSSLVSARIIDPSGDSQPVTSRPSSSISVDQLLLARS